MSPQRQAAVGYLTDATREVSRRPCDVAEQGPADRAQGLAQSMIVSPLQELDRGLRPVCWTRLRVQAGRVERGSTAWNTQIQGLAERAMRTGQA